MARNAARRRLTRSVLVLVTSYVVILTAVAVFFRQGGHVGALAYVVAILPALPIVGMVLVFSRYLAEESDEYLRMKFNRQVLIATGLMLTVATVWGFLERFGLATHVDASWAGFLWVLGFGVGRVVNLLKFGEDGCC
jgi:Kef-type K+ transport system membrane component KefB